MAGKDDGELFHCVKMAESTTRNSMERWAWLGDRNTWWVGRGEVGGLRGMWWWCGRALKTSAATAGPVEKLMGEINSRLSFFAVAACRLPPSPLDFPLTQIHGESDAKGRGHAMVTTHPRSSGYARSLRNASHPHSPLALVVTVVRVHH